MLPIVYGNFLRKADITRFRYEKTKPNLLLFANCLTAFALSAVLVSCSFLAYEKFFNQPIQDYDPAILQERKALNNELLQQAALIREARPESIDIKSVINRITEAKPKAVAITGIDITPTRYSIRCQTKDLKDADSYVEALGFGKGKKVALANIQQAKGCFEFTIDVTNKSVGKKVS